MDALGRGLLSFVALRRAVGGIRDAMLADRLTEAQLLSRSVDPEPPVAVAHELTVRGERAPHNAHPPT